jgi:riboflavin kinase/FMN adenylyltransferase
MKVFRSDEVQSAMAGGAITIGNFDGVHRGHQKLIKETLHQKGEKSSGVLTFSPHPNFFLKETPFFSLTTEQQKLRLFELFKLQVAIILPVTKEFLLLSAETFVKEILVKQLQVKHIIVGDDFTFGKGAQGDVTRLVALEKQCGFRVHVVPPVMIGGERCSSTMIRHYLREGKINEARSMLGRPFSLLGVVVLGQGKGGLFGFSTANLTPPEGFGLRPGVYATMTRVFSDHSFSDFLSATNVGVRPTIAEEKNLVVETHCLDVSGLDLVGQTIEVFFIERIRDERKFPSISALQEQVQKDCSMIRQSQRLVPHLFHVEG